MLGYNDNPEATGKAIDAEGWLHTGDLGTMDARGYLRVTGRVKEMIIRGGENLFPAEIENILLEHPDVAEVAVVGVPDERWGEVVACFVRLAPGAALDPAALRTHCRANLAPQKTPAHWIAMTEWPLTGSGKIQKFVLRDRFVAGEFDAAQAGWVSEPRTALVTGASRGVGRGVAIALAEAGYRVFATGRSVAGADLPDAVIRLPCDHLDDAQTAAVFAEATAHGRLDLLVNSAWGGYEGMVEDGAFTWPAPFWEQPMRRWTAMMDAGVRAAFVCSAHAARIMTAQRSGLIVNLSFWAAQKRLGNAIYGAAKAATDKLSADMAQELAPYGVAVLSLYPGLVRTEAVLAAAAEGAFDLAESESPEFIGRVIAALADDPRLMARSGQALVAASVAEELSVVDIDGRQPRPLTIDDV